MKIDPRFIAERANFITERAVDDENFVEIGIEDELITDPQGGGEEILPHENESMEEIHEVEFLLKSWDPNDNIIIKF